MHTWQLLGHGASGVRQSIMARHKTVVIAVAYPVTMSWHVSGFDVSIGLFHLFQLIFKRYYHIALELNFCTTRK